MKTHDELVTLLLSDPEVQAAYDALADEFGGLADPVHHVEPNLNSEAD